MLVTQFVTVEEIVHEVMTSRFPPVLFCIWPVAAVC